MVNSRAVILLRVSVPVLSEQIAETEPSVSTDGRRLTMAPWPASCACAHGIHGGDHGRQTGGNGRDRQGYAGDEDGIHGLPVAYAHDAP